MIFFFSLFLFLFFFSITHSAYVHVEDQGQRFYPSWSARRSRISVVDMSTQHFIHRPRTKTMSNLFG